jgi:hypothetical protein
MFNEAYMSKEDGGIGLAFIKSLNVQAYPCGRRKGFIDKDNNTNTTTDQYYIPFDPEARLNTEANNRKHSSLNGFTQTYLKKWDAQDKSVVLVLEGYLFKIKLDTAETDEQNQITEFGNQCCTKITSIEDYPADKAAPGKIYANIRITETELFTGFNQTYTTGVLRDQRQSGTASTNLDFLSSGTSDYDNVDNYYFSGLSFSAEPLPPEEGQITRSLQILTLVNNTWQICQSSLLPEIRHGETEDSVELGTVYADTVRLSNGSDSSDISVPALKLVSKGDSTYQLQFSNVDGGPSSN